MVGAHRVNSRLPATTIVNSLTAGCDLRVRAEGEMKVAIIGGGIGGMSLALSLDACGLDNV
jgi:NADH dehydrogenase FAD-containing subunit